jgi:hypothetical protein
VVRELDADRRNGAGRTRTRRRGKGIPILRRIAMENAIGTPKWLEKEQPALFAMIETINAELRDKPNMSLAEFARNVDKLVINGTYQRICMAMEKQGWTI